MVKRLLRKVICHLAVPRVGRVQTGHEAPATSILPALLTDTNVNCQKSAFSEVFPTEFHNGNLPLHENFKSIEGDFYRCVKFNLPPFGTQTSLLKRSTGAEFICFFACALEKRIQ